MLSIAQIAEVFVYCLLTLHRPGFLHIGMAFNFCLNGAIEMKFGMQIVLGKVSRYREKI